VRDGTGGEGAGERVLVGGQGDEPAPAQLLERAEPGVRHRHVWSSPLRSGRARMCPLLERCHPLVAPGDAVVPTGRWRPSGRRPARTARGSGRRPRPHQRSPPARPDPPGHAPPAPPPPPDPPPPPRPDGRGPRGGRRLEPQLRVPDEVEPVLL